MGTHDLFQNVDVDERCVRGKAVPSSPDGQVLVAAHKLAVRFTEPDKLPPRYKRLSDPSGPPAKKRKVKEDSDNEKRFKANVEWWMDVIKTMLAKLDEGQAWRFINLSPRVAGPMDKVTDSKDFCDFVDYMILRRDKEQCGQHELGGLALLSVAFQREVEKQLQT